MSEDPPASDTPIAQLDLRLLPVVSPALALRIKEAANLVSAAAPLAPAGVTPVRPIKPGVERWPVKTGVDPDATSVGANGFAGPGSAGIVDTTVEELIELPRPRDMADINGFQEDYQERRAQPVEFVIWRVQADITVIKKEADGDLHIVLQGDSGRTMVAEAPTADPPFVESSSPWVDAMRTVRRQIAERFGPSFAGVTFRRLDAKFLMPAGPVAAPPAAALGSGLLTVPPGTVEAFESLPPFEAKVERTPVIATGVGFFDRVHGQTGVAMKNGIELHPILALEFA